MSFHLRDQVFLFRLGGEPHTGNPAGLRAGSVGMISAIFSICVRVGKVRFR